MNNREYKLSIIDSKIEKAFEIYQKCTFCMQLCKIDRTKNIAGKCRVHTDIDKIKIASHTLHFGEEPCLVGNRGSGTVFFSNCNLACVYCQNYQISNEGVGDILTTDELADIFIDLQTKNAININFVSATHTIYQVLISLKKALLKGLCIPIVYNTNSYETKETLSILEGLVDIYLPDIKYFEDSYSVKYSNAKNYFESAIVNIIEMKRQVGDIVLCRDNTAIRGIIVRHLILPNNVSGSYDILLELKNNNFRDTTISIMSQYSPQYKATNYEEINRKITVKEYNEIIDFAISLGFNNILSQELESTETYLPDFDNTKNPFNI